MVETILQQISQQGLETQGPITIATIIWGDEKNELCPSPDRAHWKLLFSNDIQQEDEHQQQGQQQEDIEEI